jgi:hypothetical protein
MAKKRKSKASTPSTPSSPKPSTRQLKARHGAPFIRRMMHLFRGGEITAAEGCRQLDIGRSRFYTLYSSWLAAWAHGAHEAWQPKSSGGDRRPAWPADVQALARRLLTSDPPASYALVASEIARRCKHPLDRASIRRFAKAEGLAPAGKPRGTRAGVKRWQRQQIGELWQLDATPHAFFPGNAKLYPLLDMLDDCSRLITGARLYESETLLAYLDFLPRAFEQHGLPLALYVDYHSIFFTHTPDVLTQLGSSLHFYGISLLYAPTPQAKGKVERLHQLWQGRLPPLLNADEILTVPAANLLLEDLRTHRNEQEKHREPDCPPWQAWKTAKKEKRSALRPFRRDPWWPYVWSVRTKVRVADDGTVAVGIQRLKVPAGRGEKLVRCQHPDGSYTILKNQPDAATRPEVLLRCGPSLSK